MGLDPVITMAVQVITMPWNERSRWPGVADHDAVESVATIARRMQRHPGYPVSIRARMQIEKLFGWMKSIGGLRRTRTRGIDRLQLSAYLIGAAYNLLRLSRLTTVR